MRLSALQRIDTIPPDTAGKHDDRLFVMFHGYGNDEHEMVRVIEAVYATGPHDEGQAPDAHQPSDSHGSTGNADPHPLTAAPSYLSFRATYDRPYMGGAYWYPDGCGVEERRRECSRVGDAVVELLDSPLFASRKKILVGFSQGGYMSYRIVREHPDVFDAAVLMSPSFQGEETTDLTGFDSSTRFLLLYGADDHTIPQKDQRTARRVLDTTGKLEYREYPGMGHSIHHEEIKDIRMFLGL